MSQCVLLLFAPLTLEDDLVDWLLAREGIGGFFSSGIDAHGMMDARLSIAEQVTGRQRMKLIQVSLPAAEVEKVVADLRASFASAQLRFRVQAVLDGGTL